MDSDGLPIVGTGIDFTKVGAIHQKRTLAFLNHFVSHTVRFLNRFSCVCEEKLEKLTIRLQRLETTMNILDAKLSSIPGLEGVTVPKSSAPAAEAVSEASVPEKLEVYYMDPVPTSETSKPEEVKEEKPRMTVSQDTRYMKYFKMVAVGVPAAALRSKMAGEGLDPDLLETPDAPVPDAQSPSKNQGGDAEFSSDENQASSDNDDDSSGFSD